METDAELYIKLVQLAIILLLLGYFVYRRLKDRITGFTWFIALFSLIVVQALGEITIYDLTNRGIMDSQSSLQELHMFPSAMALVGLFLYLELIRHEKPNTYLLALVSLMFGGYIAVYVVELFFNLESSLAPEYRGSRVILNILQAVVIAEALYVFSKDAIKVEYLKLRRISFAMAVAAGIAFVFAFLKIFERWLIITNPSFTIYGAIPFIITFGILAIAFIANPFYVYFLPTKINKIIIFHESGILLYSVRIGHDEPELDKDTLFTGTVTAIRSLLKETTGTTSELKKISFRDKKLLLVENKERTVNTMIISDSDSFILQAAAKQFSENFYKKYKDEIDNFSGKVSVYRDAVDIVRRVFPFVPHEEIIQD